MAIIKFTWNGGSHSNIPNYITCRCPHFWDRTNALAVGWGSGGGTEINKSELMTYALELYDRGDHTFHHFFDPNSEDYKNGTKYRDATRDEFIAQVNEFCEFFGI